MTGPRDEVGPAAHRRARALVLSCTVLVLLLALVAVLLTVA